MILKYNLSANPRAFRPSQIRVRVSRMINFVKIFVKVAAQLGVYVGIEELSMFLLILLDLGGHAACMRGAFLISAIAVVVDAAVGRLAGEHVGQTNPKLDIEYDE